MSEPSAWRWWAWEVWEPGRSEGQGAVQVGGGPHLAGRVSMPGWQKRQPRVQPRRISMVMRSCTVCTKGTSPSCWVGSGEATRRLTRGGTPSRIGTTAPPNLCGGSSRSSS